ncbi:divalent metal cation transporter [Vibrio fluvialis]|nr:divalent metal cation transporter [Vibrio fluvialis]MBY7906584.1 divalent metal cation transporter [Vibrio fluvialis]MBY8176635.1 divalent metal cation transporter [Vibrio fluvialis]MBY8197352.1 divalent metal cation transporter [Vibrio fluvialis]
MVIAGFVNAAAAFHASDYQHVAEIETAYRILEPLVGKTASILFGVSLIASDLSSTVVGTMAGQVVMQGFVRTINNTDLSYQLRVIIITILITRVSR